MAQPAIERPAWRVLANGALLAVALAAIAVIASCIARDWLNPTGPSPVSAVLCAVLLGVVWRNTVGLGATYLPGVQWIPHSGLSVSLSDLRGVGSKALLAALLVAAAVCGTSLLMALLTQHFG